MGKVSGEEIKVTVIIKVSPRSANRMTSSKPWSVSESSKFSSDISELSFSVILPKDIWL
jgi:hypothetical protein